MELEYNTHKLVLNIKDLSKFSVWRVDDKGKKIPVVVIDKTFDVSPGKYMIVKK